MRPSPRRYIFSAFHSRQKLLSQRNSQCLRLCSYSMAAEGDKAQDPPSFGGWQPSEPASSILAAHFPSRLASQGPSARQLSRETFSQLREELFRERYNQQSRLGESIADVNKLICIVLKAGLEVSPSKGDLIKGLEQQVLDCLDIIHASVEKNSQVLWDISDPLIIGESAHAPLFVWLVLRLIKLAGTWSLSTIQDKIHQTFGVIVSFQHRQLRSSSQCSNILTFLCACLSGLYMLRCFSNLRKPGPTLTLHQTSFNR